MTGKKANKANKNKIEKFNRLHPEGRKIYALKRKQSQLEQKLAGVKVKLRNLGKEEETE